MEIGKVARKNSALKQTRTGNNRSVVEVVPNPKPENDERESTTRQTFRTTYVTERYITNSNAFELHRQSMVIVTLSIMNRGTRGKKMHPELDTR